MGHTGWSSEVLTGPQAQLTEGVPNGARSLLTTSEPQEPSWHPQGRVSRRERVPGPQQGEGRVPRKEHAEVRGRCACGGQGEHRPRAPAPASLLSLQPSSRESKRE